MYAVFSLCRFNYICTGRMLERKAGAAYNSGRINLIIETITIIFYFIYHSGYIDSKFEFFTAFTFDFFLNRSQ